MPDSSRPVPAALRRPLVLAAVLIALVKALEFAADSQALFFPDSGAYVINAVRWAFIPLRSYVYGDLIRIFALPFHALPAIVAMQVSMGAITAWLLAFALLRFFGVRHWIGILAALVFAIDPVQIVHERMVMTETSTLLAMAILLVTALWYLERPTDLKLVALALEGVFLVSLRIVYLPVVLAAAVLLPLAGFSASPVKKLPHLVRALAVSCLATLLFQSGYQHLTGRLAHREPAYHYSTGAFLLASVSPLIEPADSRDPRVAQLIEAQRTSRARLSMDFRASQLWDPDGLIARIRAVYGKDESVTDRAAREVAVAAIRRNPFGYLKLAANTWLDYWRHLPKSRWMLESENGMQPPNTILPYDLRAIRAGFHVDVSAQDQWHTPSRRYHVANAKWQVFLLLAPFLAGLACLLRSANPQGAALLFGWGVLVLAAVCLGAAESAYRYLHPFSFLSLAACAMLADELLRRKPEQHRKLNQNRAVALAQPPAR